MLRRTTFFLPLVILLVASLPVHAADSPLDAVSTDASLVIRIKNPKAILDKVAALAESLVKGSGDLVRSQAKIGELISNPMLVGVDMESEWWVAVFAEGGSEEPDVVFLIPATDLKAMKEEIGDDVKFVERGKLAIYTEDAEMASDVAKRLKGEGKSISTLIDKESTAVFNAGDFGVFINVPQLAEAYKSRITELKEQATQFLENAGNAPGAAGASGFDPKQATEIAGKVFTLLLQGLDDTQACTMGATVSKEGLSFEDLVRVKGSSPTDKLLAKSPPAALPSLSSLPAGFLTYFGLTWDTSDFTQLNQLMMGAGGAALKPDTTKEFTALLTEISKLKIGSMVSAFGLGDIDDGAVRSVSITEVDKPAKMRELSQKLIKAMSSVETQGVKQTFDVKMDAEKYGKNSADIVKVKTEVVEADNPIVAGMMERISTAMFGPDGMTTRIVYLKDRVVQTMGGGKQSMTDALAALEKSPGDTSKSPMQQTRAKLGAKANLVFLLDLSNTVSKILAMAVESQSVPIPIDPDTVKDLQSKPSYLGFSFGTEAQGLRVKTVVPLEQMQGIAKIVKFIQEVVGGMGAGAAEEEKEEN